MQIAHIPVKEYEQLAAQFNPTGFDAESWVKFAAQSGARYIVVAARDKDGFAMYNSSVSTYNVVARTPFHRDPLAELSAACAKQGILLGVYYALTNWHEPDGLAQIEPQLKELLTRYGPLLGIWLDAPPPQPVRNLIHSLQPSALINGAGREVPAAMNSSGGFNKYSNNWTSSDDLTFGLVDAVSKGRNYLLSIGPTAEGIIPRPVSTTLETVGRWLKSNAEAVYGAGPSVLNESRSGQWRCTTKPGKLFITLFHWPEKTLELDGIASRVSSAYFLSDVPQSNLKFTQTGSLVSVDLPSDPPLEGPMPDRIDRRLQILSVRAHLHRILVIQTVP